jgi:hypothetical protein
MEIITRPTSATAPWAHNPLVMPLGATDFDAAGSVAPLHLRVLKNARERLSIAGLRRLAAFGVEQDLGLDLVGAEQKRDEIGLVTAVWRAGRPIATLRLVPTGQRLTGAERLLEKTDFDDSILGPGSWEVGRVIMQPEDRHPDLLLQCLKLTLEEVMRIKPVRHFHATTTLAMARLWRRAGMRSVLTTAGTSGTKYCLVHGRVEDVIAALEGAPATPPAAAPAPIFHVSTRAAAVRVSA